MCDLETIGVPSILSVIRHDTVLTRMSPTFDLSSESGTDHGCVEEASDEVELVTVVLRKLNS